MDIEKILKAAEGGARLQAIQMIVWDYMLTPKHKRNGVEMAMKIDALYSEQKDGSQRAKRHERPVSGVPDVLSL